MLLSENARGAPILFLASPHNTVAESLLTVMLFLVYVENLAQSQAVMAAPKTLH